MSAYRKLVKERDKRAESLGYVPRDVRVPEPKASLRVMGDGLVKRAHSAMLRRIKSG